MDTLRGLLSGSPYGDDSAVEAPPVVGVDERRMQVRAYNLWASLLGDRAYPSVEDLDIENLDDFGPHSVLLDFTAGIDNPAIAFLGERLRRESDTDEEVQYINQIPSGSLLSRLTDHYLQIIANRAPIGFEAEFVNARGVTIMYRGILLPFSSDDDTIDFILGVINWKEAVASAEAEELQLSVEQALRSAPPLTAPVPVWADGPDSAHRDATPEPGFGSVGAERAPLSVADFIGEEAQQGVAVGAPADDAELADWLALARDTAERAQSADSRSRSALYQAVSQAWDFALAAQAQPEAFAELLADAGVSAQARAPMTPVVKLVFGAGYDKTRLAEYSTVLSYAADQGIGRGGLQAYLEQHPGGLKGLVRDERARRRAASGASAPSRSEAAVAALHEAEPAILLEYAAGDSAFVLFVARRMDDDHVALVASVDGDAATLARLAGKAELLVPRGEKDADHL